MNTATITIPIPPAILSPNARKHWRAKSDATRRYRRAALLATRSQGVQSVPWRSVTAQATFYWKDKRRRDQDNASAMLKAAWDGIVDSGLILDDSADVLHIQPVVFKVDKANPRVEIVIARAD